jgi:GNAT superfamily N-acetyltransferase
MERVFQRVREDWFGAQPRLIQGAVLLAEPRGELIMHVNATLEEADDLLALALQRRSFVLLTDWSRPADLGERLRRRGFRLYHVGETFLWPNEVVRPRHERRQAPAVRVEVIPRSLLPIWSEVCRRSFLQRVDPAAALAEKETAWEGMGDRARWYLGWSDGIPVATAILVQTEAAAQVLAVGTLPGMRGRGIASALMRRVIHDWQSQAQGQSFLFLDTESGGEAARLYQGLGFQPLYRRELWIP